MRSFRADDEVSGLHIPVRPAPGVEFGQRLDAAQCHADVRCDGGIRPTAGLPQSGTGPAPHATAGSSRSRLPTRRTRSQRGRGDTARHPRGQAQEHGRFRADGNPDGNDGTQSPLITTTSDQPGGRRSPRLTACPILRIRRLCERASPDLLSASALEHQTSAHLARAGHRALNDAMGPAGENRASGPCVDHEPRVRPEAGTLYPLRPWWARARWVARAA